MYPTIKTELIFLRSTRARIIVNNCTQREFYLFFLFLFRDGIRRISIAWTYDLAAHKGRKWRNRCTHLTHNISTAILHSQCIISIVKAEFYVQLNKLLWYNTYNNIIFTLNPILLLVNFCRVLINFNQSFGDIRSATHTTRQCNK